MPGSVQTSTTTVLCAHAGKATALVPSKRLAIGGQPVLTLATTFTVASCTFPAISSGGPPCVTAKFTVASTRVKSGGFALLLSDSQGTSAANGTPLTVIPNQIRVTAQ